ncbi:MAG: DUF5916 domain-containing protein [Longimicrobiales bacterium]|nr:DUF5916 domain-containing protein [Longimicrobiales bacterium]
MMKQLAAAVLLAVSPSILAGQSPQPRADGPSETVDVEPPVLRVDRAPGDIDVDGELGDPGWRGAAVATGFTEFQPREGVPSPTDTKAWMTYDDRYLYVSFSVTDDPDALRVTLADRDEVFNDDAVIVAFDTYGDNSWAYMIGANPIGVQMDARFSNNGGDDFSFDVVYESAGKVTDTGYQVELAIPFASLRFPEAEEHRWRLQLLQILPRETQRQYSWAEISLDNNCILCQSGTLVGLEGVEPGGQLEVLPSLVAGQSGSLESPADPTTFQNRDVTAEVSVGVRYPFRSGWTAEATYNPDFSQVESDASQIDVNTTFALFFPERRPFFQEGSDLFDTWINAVYTRSINDPIGAGKLLGRQGNLSVGYIGAVDEHSPLVIPLEERSIVLENGRTVSNIVRARQMFGSGSFVGGLITDRRFEGGGSGSNASADLLLRLSEQWSFEVQVVGSYTREPEAAGATEGLDDVTFGDAGYTATFDGESYLGRATYLTLDRESRGWDFELEYEDATPTYRADNGFQSRNDYRSGGVFNAYSWWPDEGFFDRISLAHRGSASWNFDGVLKRRSTGVSVSGQAVGQTFFNVGIDWDEQRFRGEFFPNMISGRVFIGSDFSDAIGVRASYRAGEDIFRQDPQIGFAQGASASLDLKPVQNVVFSPSISYARMDSRDGNELFAGFITRARLNYQFSRGLFLRVITEWNDFTRQLSVEPLLLYRLNPFSVLYIGSTHGYEEYDAPFGMERTRRQFFLKLQYLFRP